MMNRVAKWMVVLGLVMGVSVGRALAQDAAKDKPVDKALDKAKEKAKEEIEKKLGGDKPAAAAGQPSPEDMQKHMEEMMKMAAPGPQHDHFKTLVGKWDVVSTWPMPDGTTGKATGTAEYKTILDGRFVVEDLKTVGEDKMPFNGFGVTGFDKKKNKYVGVWMDSMGTAIMESEGVMDPSGKMFTATMDMPNHETGEMTKAKMTEETVSEDKRVMKMYETREGKETQTLEVTYTRAK